MRLTLLSLLSISLIALAGCSGSESSTSNTADSADTEVRVGAKKSISGLRLGKYTNTVVEDGEFTALTLEARTSRTSRDYDGIWKGTVKKGSGTSAASGGFTVVRRKIPMDSNVNGYIWSYVVKLFSKTDNKLFGEYAYTNVQNSVALYDWKTKTEQIMDLKVDSSGNRPFELDCNLTKLHDDNVFEEGLSMEEYPDIGIVETNGKLEVNIGASYFDGSDDGEKIVENSRSGTNIDVTLFLDNKPYYHVKVTNKKGVVESIENGSANKVADFSCR